MTSDFTSEPGEPTEPDELAEPASDDGPGLRASLEAILLVADEPVPEVLLAQVLERPRGEVAAGLRALAVLGSNPALTVVVRPDRVIATVEPRRRLPRLPWPIPATAGRGSPVTAHPPAHPDHARPFPSTR